MIFWLFEEPIWSLLEPARGGMVGTEGIRPKLKPYKEFSWSRFTHLGIRVWRALIVLRHSRPARILSLYTPARSQGCRTGRSAISRLSQNRPFCWKSQRKWTWLTHPRWSHTHKNFFGYLSKYFHLPKIFCGTESAGTYLYQSLEQHSERQLANIVFLRPRVCLAVRRKAPSARIKRLRAYQQTKIDNQ